MEPAQLEVTSLLLLFVGLAKVAAAMANGGTFQGVKVLGEKGWEAMHAKPTLGQLGFGSSDELYFTQVSNHLKRILIFQGGVAEFRSTDAYNARAGYYGWMGYGGSIFQWHAKLRIGFAYNPTLLEFHDMYNQRGGRLQVRNPSRLFYFLSQEEVVRCAQRLANTMANTM